MLPDIFFYDDEQENTASSDVKMPSRTYKLDFATGRISGMIDGDEALEQALKKILITPAMVYDLYSFYYGLDYEDLVGEDVILAQAELEDVIRKAVLYDNRFVSVDDFDFSVEGNTIHVKFIATTSTGYSIEEEVALDV